MPEIMKPVQPAALPLNEEQLAELHAALPTINAGEHQCPRYYAAYRLLDVLPDDSSLKRKLQADIAMQEELTTSARLSVILNGLYPAQFNYEPLVHPDLEYEG